MVNMKSLRSKTWKLGLMRHYSLIKLLSLSSIESCCKSNSVKSLKNSDTSGRDKEKTWPRDMRELLELKFSHIFLLKAD